MLVMFSKTHFRAHIYFQVLSSNIDLILLSKESTLLEHNLKLYLLDSLFKGNIFFQVIFRIFYLFSYMF